MGSSAGRPNMKPNQNQNNIRLQNLLCQAQNFSSSNPSSQTKKDQRTIPHQTKQLELTNLNGQHSDDTSERNMKQVNPEKSNFNRLSVKNQRIQKLHSILNNEIKNFEELKNYSLQKDSLKQKANKKKKKLRTHAQSVILGIWIGITIAVIIFLIALIKVNGLSITNDSQFSRDFPVWRGIAIWIFYLWILGFNVWMFNKFKIRYRQIFELMPNHYPQAIKLYRIAGFLSSTYVVLFLLYVLGITKTYQIPDWNQEYFALIIWFLLIAVLVLPVPAFSNKGRFHTFKMILNWALSPLRGVKFADTFVSLNILSFSVPLKDLQYTICYYTTLNFEKDDGSCKDHKQYSSVLIVVVLGLSMAILQCFRQAYDTGKFLMTPYFINTLKYAVSLTTALLAFQYKLGASSIQSAWLLFAVISTLFLHGWDVVMDWNLLQKNSKHPFLRQKLIFGSPKFYYFMLFANLFMRMGWVITISPEMVSFLGNSNIVSLVVGMIQILRRGVWNLLRLEKQHLALACKTLDEQSFEDKKILELEKKLSAIQQSLKLQVQMFRFFKRFEGNRSSLKRQLQVLNQGDIGENQGLIEANRKQLKHSQIVKVSMLMEQIQKIMNSDNQKQNQTKESEIEEEKILFNCISR